MLSEIESPQAWVASLSPWPADGFGLGRMRRLLGLLGDPQQRYEAVHVVGTNGKSTAARTVEALLLAEGLRVGTTTSPHVSGWAERIRIDGGEADFDAAIARVRPASERLCATQFEVITAAALAEFANAGVDVAVVEAGLGGRLDATNVLRARVVLLTNVGYEHTEVLGNSLEEIAKEKLAVAHAGTVVVLPDNHYAHLVGSNELRMGGAREAAEAYVGHTIDADVEVALPGRLEVRLGPPLEIRDGAHTVDAVEWLTDRIGSLLPEGERCVLVTSILEDKNAEAILSRLQPWVGRLVTTQSTNRRSRTATELAEIARALPESRRFPEVVAEPHPVRAVHRARELAGTGGAVLVTGSLYLLADLAAVEGQEAWRA
jgi:dihydrofolate synthase / folylpolyglutamate synthase